MSKVTVYSKRDTVCGPCIATQRALSSKGIQFEDAAIEDLPEAEIDKLRAEGLGTAPLVFTDSTRWAGFRLDLIEQLAADLTMSD
jgi:glutaredoxin-like protein NrdH